MAARVALGQGGIIGSAPGAKMLALLSGRFHLVSFTCKAHEKPRSFFKESFLFMEVTSKYLSQMTCPDSPFRSDHSTLAASRTAQQKPATRLSMGL